jgi:hypothetical protein
MQFPPELYDSDAVALMGRVCDAAWQELQVRLNTRSDFTHARDLMAMRILGAVAQGERDPERLKAIALRAIDA